MPNLTEKIIRNHTSSIGDTIDLKIDQTLTQDATGTMAYLELEAIHIDKIKTELSVSYVDHNTLQSGFENADDHRFLQSIAKKYGIVFSKCGNGICHQVHLEQFAIPGKTLLGSDSHTPTAGGIGCLAIGAGGLDVACAIAGRPFSVAMPKVMNVKLINSLPHGVSGKDVILKVLEMIGVKGGVGYVLEYSGEGVKSLSIEQRATITNMGAETGATTSIFPSDEFTLQFLRKQNREKDYVELKADDDATYDKEILIDLSELQPLVACPHSPDAIKPVSELEGLKVDQVCIGSCTNSSYTDLASVANILKGKKVNPNVSLTISCGSKQVLDKLTQDGYLSILIEAGARILECTCGPCIGMGQSPCSDAVSLRTFNRNFYGRSGTMSANIYLVSPLVAAISAINGYVSDPRNVEFEQPELPQMDINNNSLLIKESDINTQVLYGPNIKPLPENKPLGSFISAKVMIKVEDNITTDHIMPAGSKILPYRSNIEKISTFCFGQVDEDFAKRCKENGEGFIVAGENYGQGSSREHAALAPMYLGIKAVIAKSYARIHRQNLINSGIIPFMFENGQDYDDIELMDELFIGDLSNLNNTTLINNSNEKQIKLKTDLAQREIEIIRAGGLLNTIKNN